MLNRRRHMVLLFSSAMDVGSVLAENALDNLEDEYADVCSFFKSDITEDVGHTGLETNECCKMWLFSLVVLWP